MGPARLYAIIGVTLLLFAFGQPAAAQTLKVPQQYPSIQAALNVAPKGATVEVSGGTYTENPTLTNGSSINIAGMPNSNGTLPVLKGGFTLTNCANCSVHSFECDNAASAGVLWNGGSGALSVESVSTNGGQVGIWTENLVAGAHCLIEDCHVRNAVWGMYFGANSNPTVTTSNVSGAQNWGIHAEPGFGSAQFVNCVAEGCGLSNFYLLGDPVKRADTATLDYCTGIASTGYYGIEISGLRSTKVRNCIARGNYGAGFKAWYSTSPVFDHCTSYNNSDGFSFVTCANAMVSYCLAYTNVNGVSTPGADASYGTASLTVIDCTLADNADGVSVTSNWTVLLTNDLVADNAYAVAVSGASHVTNDYCDYFNNSLGFSGWEPSGVFLHGPSADPRFLDHYHLDKSSPCCHGGDPSSPKNPDGSRSAIGAFYYDGHKRVVLLVHGINSDASVWGSMSNALKTSFDVYRIDFTTNPQTQSNEASIAGQAIALRNTIESLLTSTEQPSLMLVCHSMGGIAARYYLTHPVLWPIDVRGHRYSGVSKLITLGTPYWGSDAWLQNPVIGVTAARASTPGHNTDTYSHWSAALNDLFAEWQPAPHWDPLYQTYVYPSKLSSHLSQWTSGTEYDGWRSPINQTTTYAAAELAKAITNLKSDWPAINAAVTHFPCIGAASTLCHTHLDYYAEMSSAMGSVLFPPATTYDYGITTRRISTRIYDINILHSDLSGADVYLLAGGKNQVEMGLLGWTAQGAYNGTGPNASGWSDGIVPLDSALGIEPISQQKLYQYIVSDNIDIETKLCHQDLPSASIVMTKVRMWLSE
jgi:pimeloyl-ACP methyl ester carboxylesterase